MLGQTHDADKISKSLIFIDTLHQRVHDGKMFNVSYLNTAFATGTNADFVLTLDASQMAHIRFNVVMGGDATAIFYESPTFTANGTLITPVNRNRASSTTAKTVVRRNPTVSVVGTQLFSVALPSGKDSTGIVFSPNPYEEIDLNAGLSYLFRVANISGGNQLFSFSANFYEP